MRAVLDTNIARKLGYPGDVDHDDILAGLRALKRAGFSLHLADGAILELIGQLHERRLAWPDWIRARSHLRVLLCAQDPIMLGGWEVLVEAGILPPDGRQLPDDMHKTLRLGWKILSKARTLTEIDKPRPVVIRGKRTLLGNRARRANELVQQEQRSWADGIDELYAEATSKNVSTMGISEVENVVRVVGASFDSKAPSTHGPKTSVRLDAMLRVYAHFCRLRLGRKPYNPNKRANDVFDYDLLRHLALPALICTCDVKTLVTAVDQSGTWQRRWVLGPSELRNLAHGGSPPDMNWPP